MQEGEGAPEQGPWPLKAPGVFLEFLDLIEAMVDSVSVRFKNAHVERMPLNIRMQWNAGTACVSECVLKTLACRGLRVGPSKAGTACVPECVPAIRIPRRNRRTLLSSHSPSLPAFSLPLPSTPCGSFCSAPGGGRPRLVWRRGPGRRGEDGGGPSKRYLGPDPHLGVLDQRTPPY